ncbi:MAG: Mannosylglycerate hydrolase [Lentisphaerae bacterium ADurb.BinA184]|nr:MAG: Mannosylglycerate hydrolase [Lentisphaerae bacterium ADurb.BinA184]
MITVHMIGNAHMDPVWLWRRADGIDAVLATARSACDRIAEYPDFIFTCSASWFHRQVERLDPELFARVRRAVEAGRWRIVGGMVVQPDCNLPSAESLTRQLQHGQDYFKRTLGVRADVGYNVDSFGHDAYLPRILRQAGLDAYVMMRPSQAEKALPSNVFRWRSPDAHEVTVFRINGGYGLWGEDATQHLRDALVGVPADLGHTMCFYGVGDHGGGPTRAQIEWILAHATSFDGLRLVFSHPRAFFDAIASRLDGLPLVEQELQNHAVGCYSVERRLKLAMRRAEHRLLQAEAVVAASPAQAPADAAQVLNNAWQNVLFNQFHDILGGTCLDYSSLCAAAEITDAEVHATELITTVTRRAARPLAEPGKHKILVRNTLPETFSGLVEDVPWLGGHDRLALRDETGQPVAMQVVAAPTVTWLKSLLFPIEIPPGVTRILQLVEKDDNPNPNGEAGAGLEASETRLANPALAADVGTPTAADALCALTTPRRGPASWEWRLHLEVLDDPSDTWSHSVPFVYPGPVAGTFAWRHPADVVERGPLRAALRARADYGNSRVWCRLLLSPGRPEIRLRLGVTWAQPQQLLRLRLEAAAAITERRDLVAGGPLARPLDRREYPLGGGLAVRTADGAALAVVAPEVFSVSVTPDSVNLTLLRSPHVAHHDPTPAASLPDQPVTDQGWHDFDIRLILGPEATVATAARLARAMLMPPIIWDLTG